MKLHFGTPDHDGCLRFFHGRIAATVDGQKRSQDCFFEHPIAWWFGISFARLFIGVIRTERTREARSGALLLSKSPAEGETM